MDEIFGRMKDHIPAVVCLCVALVAQFIGVIGIWRTSRHARSASTIPLLVVDDVKGEYTLTSDGVEQFIRSQIVSPWYLIIIVVGTLVGFVGSLLSF